MCRTYQSGKSSHPSPHLLASMSNSSCTTTAAFSMHSTKRSLSFYFITMMKYALSGSMRYCSQTESG